VPAIPIVKIVDEGKDLLRGSVNGYGTLQMNQLLLARCKDQNRRDHDTNQDCNSQEQETLHVSRGFPK
jgi:hypothetical protein